MAQVFVNLITNAISFCEDGDAIRVWARRRENRVLIVVEDTGPGIPNEALTKVFKRFYSERPRRVSLVTTLVWVSQFPSKLLRRMVA